MSERTVSFDAYSDLSRACAARAAERDKAEGRLLDMQIDDYARREELSQLLGVSRDWCSVREWDVLMTRLREALCTYRGRPKLPG